MKELLEEINDLTASFEGLAEHPGVDVEAELSRLSGLRDRLSARQSYAPATLVIGIAGTTGAGKSSLFNALTGSTAAKVGVKRPTTTAPMAAIFGEPEAGVGALLDWLQVSHRYTVGEAGPDLGQVIIIDLPDIDSISDHNRELARRFIAAVDVIIWVVDPEKYADSRIHDEYLRPYAAHAPVMEIILNQVDRLTREEANGALADLKRLLSSAGVDSPVFAVSIANGTGVPELIERLNKRASAKHDQFLRARADAVTLARDLQRDHPFSDSKKQVEGIEKAFHADVLGAAQVRSYANATAARYRHSIKSRVGWPPLRAMRKMAGTPPLPTLSTGFLGEPIAKLRTAFAGPGAWYQALRTTVDDSTADLSHRLDTYQPHVTTPPIGAWLRFVGVLQWLGLGLLVGAALVFGVEILARYFKLTLPPAIDAVPGGDGYPPLPALRWSVLVGIIAVAITLLVMLISTISVRISTNRYRRRAVTEVSGEIGRIVDTAVLAPVHSVLDLGSTYRAALTKITSQKSSARR